MKPKLIDINSVGVRKSMGFACGGKDSGFQSLNTPVYPPNPHGEMIRTLRVSLELSLREAATAMGISPTDLSGIERGSKGIDDVAGWKWFTERLIEVKERKRRAE